MLQRVRKISELDISDMSFDISLLFCIYVGIFIYVVLYIYLFLINYYIRDVKGKSVIHFEKLSLFKVLMSYKCLTLSL